MSFASPAVLVALAGIPALVAWYLRDQRRRARAADAFTSRPLRPSVAPHDPRWRRHLPPLALLMAVAVLILAAARPERSVAVPVADAAVMLVDDISSSMGATDVAPSRLGAATSAAERFVTSVPATVRVGLIAFSTRPAVLQSPTADRASVRDALTGLSASGHTAIGDAIAAADRALARLREPGGRRVPEAIVLLSDGTSTQGADPLAEARASAASGIPVYTVALGTPRGTITVGRRTVPVPLSAGQLRAIAAAAHGQAYSAGDAGHLSAVYAHLATRFGHKQVRREITGGFAGAGLGLVLAAAAMSLTWFGRLIR